MGDIILRANEIVDSVKQVFMETEGAEPTDYDIVDILRDDAVMHVDLAELVRAHLQDGTNSEVHFDEDDWEALKDVLRELAPKYS